MTAKKKETDPLSADAWIDLSDADYISVGLRPRVPKPLTASKAFDQEAALSQLKKLKNTDYASVRFDKMRLSPSMSKPEARYWIWAILANSTYNNYILQDIASITSLDTDIPNLALKISMLQFATPAQTAVPLFALMGFPKLLAWMNGLTKIHCRYRLIQGLREHVLQYVSESDFIVSRPILLSWLRHDPVSPEHTPSQDVALLAAELGMRDEVSERVDKIKPLVYGTEPRRDTVLRLGSASLLLAELKRKDTVIDTPALVRQCLAVSGIECLDALVDIVRNDSSKSRAESLAKTLTRAHAPEMARGMLKLMQAGIAPHVARSWFADNPAYAAIGLQPIVGPSEEGKAARGVLEELCRLGYADIVRRFTGEGFDREEYASSIAPPALPAELQDALPKDARSHPTDPPLSSLSSILIDGQDIAGVFTTAIFESMRKSTFGKPHPALPILRSVSDSQSLDIFAVALFQSWIADQMPAAARWRLIGAALIGGNGFVLELGARILEWPGQAGHARAVFGLQCLLAVSTDEAFAQLSLIADKCKFEGLKTKAKETMAALAEARSQSLDQLKDRVVPRCGLDSGPRYFDFGSRRFRFILNGEMKPMLKDENGRVSADFPQAKQSDDSVAVARAKAEWAILKKQAAQIAKTQAERMEKSMARCRRWSTKEFREYIVGHPIMSLLAQRIVWAAYSEKSTPSTFRVTEDLTLAGIDDNLYKLSDTAQIGIAHPVSLTEGERNTWGEILSDYEIVPPFRQLTREIYTLDETEQASQELARYTGVDLDSYVALKILRHKNWQLVGAELRKVFDGQGVTAVIRLAQETWSNAGPSYTSEACHIYRGQHIEVDLQAGERMFWGDVDPIVPSEILRDLHGAVDRKR